MKEKIIEIIGFNMEPEKAELIAQQVLDLFAVSGSLPSDEDFETALEKEAFRVPYDGSNNFYDEPTLKHWRKCWEWVKNAVSNDR